LSRRERRRSRRARQARQEKAPLIWQRSGPAPKGRGAAPQPKVAKGGGGFYIPPWLPVAGIIVAVVAIFLGLVLFRETSTASPRIGDHWHAAYEIIICGTRQPPLPSFPGGVHTHGDGYIHLHPQFASEEGRGASLVRFFEYAGRALGSGGVLTRDTLQVPGDPRVFRNGDICQEGPDQGQPGVVQVFVNGERRLDFEDYVPRDGDRVQIVFGPERAAPTPSGSPAPAPD
jgi:hypothetical protein